MQRCAFPLQLSAAPLHHHHEWEPPVTIAVDSSQTTRNRFRLPQMGADQFLQTATLWQLAAAALSAVGVAITFIAEDQMRYLVVISLRVLLIVAVPLRLLAAWWLSQRTHRGRALAFGLDYLSALGAGFALAHQLRVFSGFDAFAGQFRQDFKPALVLFAGILIARFGYSRRESVAWSQVATRAGLAIAAIGGGWFLIAAGAPNSLLGALQRVAHPKSLGTLLVLIACATAAKGLLSDRTARAVGTTREQSDALDGWLFLSPNLIGFAAFFIGPLAFSLVISFYNWNLGKKTFLGLENYGKLFSLRFTGTGGTTKEGYARLISIDWFGFIGHFQIWAMDVRFWTSLRNIIYFLVIALPLAMIPSLLIAQLLTQKLPGMKVFRAVFFVPSVAGVVSISLIWKLLLNSSIGFVNYGLARLSRIFDFLPFVTARERVEIVWLSSSWTIVPLAVVFAWMTFGYNTVLFTAGMQSVPHELHEAAALDGATAWQRFRSVTIPLLRPTTFYVLVTTMVMCLQMFDIVWVLTRPPGGPADATLTPVLYTYDQGFQQDRQGYAAAVAWVLAILLILLAIFQFRRQKRYAI
jgi:ABC-type sugar transport system permease subunit